MHSDVCIIGAGAAGLMCAIEAGKRSRSVRLLEKADKPGRKILISGGGRCNFTNLYVSPESYLSNNPHFCKSALARYSQWNFIQLLEKHQLGWHEKTLGQLFCDQKSRAVLDMLLQECAQQHVEIDTGIHIHAVNKNNRFEIDTNQGLYSCDSLVIASGGPSIPRMGSTDFGVQIAKQFGLKTIPFRAALVPFTFVQQQLETFFKDLAGVSLPVEVSCQQQHFRENMLFTHGGLSGPAMLQISSYWNKGDILEVDLLPDRNLIDWFREQQQLSPNTELKNALAQLLPRRLALRLCESHLVNKPLRQFNESEIDKTAALLHAFSFKPSGTEGMRTAEVSLGGVDTDEISSKTFETKRLKGLYFCGETIDVTGHLGGYNFQWAWSSGWCTGQYV